MCTLDVGRELWNYMYLPYFLTTKWLGKPSLALTFERKFEISSIQSSLIWHIDLLFSLLCNPVFLLYSLNVQGTSIYWTNVNLSTALGTWWFVLVLLTFLLFYAYVKLIITNKIILFMIYKIIAEKFNNNKICHICKDKLLYYVMTVNFF